MKHTDDPDPDVSDEEHSDDANAGMVEKPEEGAVFEIYLTSAGSYENAKESERDILKTDADGFAASKDMPYGRYTVHQTAGEDDKAFVPDFTVFISENGKTYSYILNNDAITARVRVEKRDAETGEIIPIAGTGFRIKDLTTGEFISQEIYYPNPETIDVFYTSDEGWLMIYHGVINTCNGFVYRMGVALLDLDEPWKVKARSRNYILAPQELYECVGDVPNVTFPCAALTDAETGRIAIYYGCADTVTGLAFTTVEELMRVMREFPL